MKSELVVSNFGRKELRTYTKYVWTGFSTRYLETTARWYPCSLLSELALVCGHDRDLANAFGRNHPRNRGPFLVPSAGLFARENVSKNVET